MGNIDQFYMEEDDKIPGDNSGPRDKCHLQQKIKQQMIVMQNNLFSRIKEKLKTAEFKTEIAPDELQTAATHVKVHHCLFVCLEFYVCG